MTWKALTLFQPWASLIVHGPKTIETRSWLTHVRGDFMVHASKGLDRGWPQLFKPGAYIRSHLDYLGEKLIRDKELLARDLKVESIARPSIGDLEQRIAEMSQEFALLKACRTEIGVERLIELPRGAVVGASKIVGCNRTESLLASGRVKRSPDLELPSKEHEFYFGNYARGRHGFMLEGSRPIASPVPCKGLQTFWTVPEEVARQVEAQLNGVVPKPAQGQLL